MADRPSALAGTSPVAASWEWTLEVVMSTPERSPLAAPVVVGVDGSDASFAAVDLAAREATLRRRPLRIVHAFIWPYLHVPLGPSPYGPPGGGLRHQAEQILADAHARAHAAAPQVPIHGELITGEAAAVLCGSSRTAGLVVIGDRGLGGISGLLVGSVAVQLAAHAACPIVVARGSADPAAPVLLGVDGSPANNPAVGFAFEEAALRGVPLTAMHTWTHPVSTGHGDMLPLVYDAAEVEADENRVLAEALAGWHDRYPDVVVHRDLTHGGARQALIDATGRAQLVVVGTRGRGGFTGLLLGSVSQAVLHHAACPVAIVPHRRTAT
jgi:nucleotide-binding universal stress UspA family protein